MSVNRPGTLTKTRRTWAMAIIMTPPYVTHMVSQKIVSQNVVTKNEYSLNTLANFWCGSSLAAIGLFVRHRKNVFNGLQRYKAIVFAQLRHREGSKHSRCTYIKSSLEKYKRDMTAEEAWAIITHLPLNVFHPSLSSSPKQL